MVNQTTLKELLDYNKNTGIFTWAKSRPKCRKGAIAGGLDSAGYVQIRILGVKYLAHRLAWLYEYGEWPDADLDHKDDIKNNNAIDNLQLATSGQNNHKKKTSKINKTGFRGVTASGKRFTARIKFEGNTVNLGSFDTPEAAGLAYENKAVELYGKFYTEGN